MDITEIHIISRFALDSSACWYWFLPGHGPPYKGKYVRISERKRLKCSVTLISGVERNKVTMRRTDTMA